MTQSTRTEYLWVCDAHEIEVYVVATESPVQEPCPKCKKNMYNTGWIETKEEEPAKQG